MNRLDYIHRTHPRAKRLSVKIDQAGKVVVVTPRFTPGWLIKKFVTDNQEWIAAHQQKLSSSRSALLDTPSTLLLFGKKYQAHVRYLAQQAPGVYTQADQLVINPFDPKTNSLKDCSQQLTRFLKKSARRYIEPQSLQLAEKMSLNVSKIQFRAQKSRWGSCSHTGTLSFNWRLVHCPVEIINYVVIHELAHLVHFDHSRAFWTLVAQHDPAYQQNRGWLKKHGGVILSLQDSLIITNQNQQSAILTS
ncbi:MAG: SprT family zinc-dependent metalloprotease [Patescibacteria group bacterium]